MSTKRKRRWQPPPSEIVTSIRITRHQRDRLQELAQREHRTFAAEMRRAVERYIAEHDTEQKEAA